MLKKLVKYGNSNALIFDKAILELLEIGEGSVLKIKTDGKSLIITPHASTQEEKISRTVTFNDTITDNIRDTRIDSVLKQYSDLTPERRLTLAGELKALHAQRQTILEGLPEKARVEFARETNALLLKNGMDSQSPEYQATYIKLRNQLVPTLAFVDDQILNFEATHGLNPAQAMETPALTLRLIATPTATIQQTQSVAQEAMQKFTELWKKHAVAQRKLTEMQANPDFIHESQLLVEKWGGNFDVRSPEYVSELQALHCKYVPEARALYEEMAVITKKIGAGQ